MESKNKRSPSSSSEPWPVVTKKQFFERIVVDTYDRFALIFLFQTHCIKFKIMVITAVIVKKEKQARKKLFGRG